MHAPNARTATLSTTSIGQSNTVAAASAAPAPPTTASNGRDKRNARKHELVATKNSKRRLAELGADALNDALAPSRLHASSARQRYFQTPRPAALTSARNSGQYPRQAVGPPPGEALQSALSVLTSGQADEPSPADSHPSTQQVLVSEQAVGRSPVMSRLGAQRVLVAGQAAVPSPTTSRLGAQRVLVAGKAAVPSPTSSRLGAQRVLVAGQAAIPSPTSSRLGAQRVFVAEQAAVPSPITSRQGAQRVLLFHCAAEPSPGVSRQSAQPVLGFDQAADPSPDARRESAQRLLSSEQAVEPSPTASQQSVQLELVPEQAAAASLPSAQSALASDQVLRAGKPAKRVGSMIGKGKNAKLFARAMKHSVAPLARFVKQSMKIAVKQTLQRAMNDTAHLAFRETLETVVKQSVELAVRQSVEVAVKSSMDRAVNDCMERVMKMRVEEDVKVSAGRAASPVVDCVSTNKRRAECIAEAPLSTSPRERKRRHLGHQLFGDGTVTAPARCVGSDQYTSVTETPVHLQAGQYCVCEKVYTAVAVLDEGGSASVYRVLGADGCEYALKRIVLTKLPDEARERAWAEVVILQKLQDCPSVIRLIGASQQEDEIHIVFELGEATLETRLRELDANPDRAVLLDLWKQMLTAVRDVHAKNIIHGDLKPSNFVFVGGVLKIIDVGISVVVCDGDTHFVRGRGIGTMDYISPEALQPPQDEKFVKIRFLCDVWSLGIILFRMLFGRTPFAEFDRVWKEYYTLSPGAIEFPTNGDHAIQAVLEQCLQHDQSCRPSVSSLLQQLARL